ncbi:hypothetical protein Aperf_G00000063854 [Anoplocephala perfoliata]
MILLTRRREQRKFILESSGTYLIVILILLLCTASTTSQTVPVDIPACFGISGTIHRSELHPMHAGAAYALKTRPRGIPLEQESTSTSSAAKACAFAFTLPTHPQFHSLTVFIKLIELNTTKVDDYVNLLFLDNRNILSNLHLTKSPSPIVNSYLDTQSWPRNTTIVFVFLLHNCQGREARLFLDISLTPTYLCLLNSFKDCGSFTNIRSPSERSLMSLNELFHPGWLICTIPVEVGVFGLKVSYRYVTQCIDYRLSCDGVVNCPNGETNISTKQMLSSNDISSADEYSRGLVCYAPSVNWFLVMIIFFSIFNVILLCLISYVGLLRRYSQPRYLRLRNRCLRYTCCCLPTTWRLRLATSPQFLHRKILKSADSNIPRSPPTYASVEQADSENISNQRRSKGLFRAHRQKPVVVPQSGHHLPPSYSEVDEEIGVASDRLIQRIENMNTSTTFLAHKIRKTISPRSKHFSRRFRRSVNNLNLGIELRVLLRRMMSRSRSLMTSGLRITRPNQDHQSPSLSQLEQPPQIAERGSTSRQPAPPPNYTEFLSGDFPRFPDVVRVDYIQPPPPGYVGRARYRRPRRQRLHSRRQ